MRFLSFLAIITMIGYAEMNADKRTTVMKLAENINIGSINLEQKFATKIIYYHYPPTMTTEGKITAPYDLQPEYWHGQRFLGEIESSFAGTPQDLYICIMSSFKFFKNFTNVPDEDICDRETRTFAEYLKYRLISEEEQQELKSVKKRMKILTKPLIQQIISMERINSNETIPVQQQYFEEKQVLENGEQPFKNINNSMMKIKKISATIFPVKDDFKERLKHKNVRQTNITKPISATKFHEIMSTTLLPEKLKHKNGKQTMINLNFSPNVTKFQRNTSISPVKQHFYKKGDIINIQKANILTNRSTTAKHQQTTSEPLISTEIKENQRNSGTQTMNNLTEVTMELYVNGSTKMISPDQYFETWPVNFGLTVIGTFILLWLIFLSIVLCVTQKKRSCARNTCALTAFQTGTFKHVENV